MSVCESGCSNSRIDMSSSFNTHITIFKINTTIVKTIFLLLHIEATYFMMLKFNDICGFFVTLICKIV